MTASSLASLVVENQSVTLPVVKAKHGSALCGGISASDHFIVFQRCGITSLFPLDHQRYAINLVKGVDVFDELAELLEPAGTFVMPIAQASIGLMKDAVCRGEFHKP